MNITLSANEKVIERVRAIAQERGTTLNELIRQHLEQIARQKTGAEWAAEFLELTDRSPGRSPEGWVFNREEIYDRNG